MIPSNFDYVAPTTVDEAVAALTEAGEDAKVIAGGQSLMPVLRLRLAAPTTVVDLGRIDELQGLREDGTDLVIGAMTTYYDLLRNPLLGKHALLIAEAIRTVADPQIRHRGTLGGALAHADPAGDLCAPALALDATLTVAGPSGQRSIPAAEFFVDYFTTAIGETEILTEVRFPRYTGWGSHYEKMSRTAQAWSMVGVAAAIRTDGGSARVDRHSAYMLLNGAPPCPRCNRSITA